MSAIKASFAIYNLNIHLFQDPRLKYYMKSLALHKPFKVTLKNIVDIPTLTLIVQSCDLTYMGQVVKAFYLIAFFSFLRISNLVPHSRNSYSLLQQLAQGDVLFAPPGFHILVKWSKTLQTKDKIKIIKVPALGASLLCPVMALKVLLKVTPNHPNLPLFQIKQSQSWLPLTDTKVRCHFPSHQNSHYRTLQLPSTHAVVQVPPLLIMPMSHYKKFNPMAPGPRSVSGITLLRITRPHIK